MSKHTTTVSAIALAALFIALTAFLAYGRWMRAQLLPSALRYVPPEANVVIGIGDIGSVWNGIDFHFGRVLREKDRESVLAAQLNALGESQGVAHKTDLVCRYGIDIDRGVLLGLSLDIGSKYAMASEALEYASEHLRKVTVIPVANDARQLERYCGGSRAPRSPNARASNEGGEPSCPNLQVEQRRTPSEDKLVRFFCSEQVTPIPLSTQLKAGQYECDASILLAARGSDPSWVVADHAYQLEHRWLVFPEPDTAVLSDSCEFLDSGLGEQQRNLAYARSDDSLFEAVRYQLRRPLLSGPGMLIYVRGIAADFVPVGTASATINLVPEAILGDVRVRTSGVNAQIADKLLSATSEEMHWRQFSDRDDAAMVVLRDPAIASYLEFVSSNPHVAMALRSFLGGILEPARRLKHLEQLVVRGTDYREGLPQLVLGMWGEKQELEQLIFDVQRSLRQSRDEAILEGALQRFAGTQPDHPPTLAELLQSPDLRSEAAKYKRFRLTDSAIESDPLTADDFSTPDFAETYGQYHIHYLEPAVTAADVRYRLPNVEDEGERSLLLENRYRLAAAITDNVLWVSTGKQQLVRLLDSLSRERPVSEFAADEGGDDERNKLRLLISMSSLIKKGMLSGEQDIEAITDQLLLDFRYHREITISVKPAARKQEVRLEFAIRGPVSGGLASKGATGGIASGE